MAAARSTWNAGLLAAAVAVPVALGALAEALDIEWLWVGCGVLVVLGALAGLALYVRQQSADGRERERSSRAVLSAPYRTVSDDSAGAWRRAPSFLLRPEYRIVEFRGREDELFGWHAWCAADDPLAIGLLTGAGGSGKSRLAAELCERRIREDWVAGSLPPGTPADAIDRLADLAFPCLIVIDEAQSRPDEVVEVLAAVAATSWAAKARVLLLAREGGAWWELLPERLYARHLPVDAGALALGARTERLASLEESLAGRSAAFADAVAAFAKRLRVHGLAPEPPDLDRPAYADPLFLHLAALNAVLDPADARGEPLRAAVDRERRYWRETARSEAIELHDRVLDRAVAVATLTSARSESDAAAALAAVPELAASDPFRRDVARWLRTLYPGERGEWFRPVRPDLIGEALVAGVLDDLPEFPSAVLGRVAVERSKRSLEVLVRVVANHPTAEGPVLDALSAGLDRLWRPALEIARATGQPMARLLLAALERNPSPDVARGMLDAIPAETVQLRELALRAAEVVVADARAAPAEPARDRLLVSALIDLSNRLVELDRHAESLPLVEEALELARGLPDPDEPVGATLTTLAGLLFAVGRPGEGLRAGEEGIAAYRACADAIPDRVRPNLAAALLNQGLRLRLAGDQLAALAATEVAVARARDLVGADHPDGASLLADALMGLCEVHGPAGDLVTVLAAAEEAVTILRRLADQDPDAHRPKAARALDLLRVAREASGSSEDSRALLGEALEIRREIARARPAAFSAQFGATLSVLAETEQSAGRFEAALEQVEQALAVARELEAQQPARFGGELAGYLSNLGAALCDLGRFEEALTALEEAEIVARRALPERRHQLALALHTRGRALAALKRRDDAVAAVAASVATFRELDRDNLGAFRLEVAYALNLLAVVQNDVDAALAASNEAAAILLALPFPAAGPRARRQAWELDQVAKRQLALAESLSAAGRAGDALTCAQRGIDVRVALVGAGWPQPPGVWVEALTKLASYAEAVGQDALAAQARERVSELLADRTASGVGE